MLQYLIIKRYTLFSDDTLNEEPKHNEKEPYVYIFC